MSKTTNIRRGTPLAALMLLVGAGALLAGMGASILNTRRTVPESRGLFLFSPFFPFRPLLSAGESTGLVIGLSVLLGIACGVGVAARREVRFGLLLAAACVGTSLGALAGGQLLSDGDLRMTITGSLALIAFGGVIRATSDRSGRMENEIQWFQGDEPLDAATGVGRTASIHSSTDEHPAPV